MWHRPELLGLSGAVASCGARCGVLVCASWAICCAGSAGVHCDFLVGLVGVVSSCLVGLLLLWMMSYVCILMANKIVIRVCK